MVYLSVAKTKTLVYFHRVIFIQISFIGASENKVINVKVRKKMRTLITNFTHNTTYRIIYLETPYI